LGYDKSSWTVAARNIRLNDSFAARNSEAAAAAVVVVLIPLLLLSSFL